MSDPVISVAGLGKSYENTRALDDVWLDVPAGTVLGLLGHNGAGKTTLVGILSTLVPPTAGVATVAGYDVVSQGHQVRRRIGLTGQYAAVDEQISGLDNLVLVARLLGYPRRQATAMAGDLLEVFGLTDAGRRKVRTYSGGMRRRLDLAAGLVGDPEVLFLDEPTTGLDPESRMAMWEIVEKRVSAGTTVLLTTQYLDEADRLADSLAVLEGGRVVFAGLPAELKARYGRRVVSVRLAGEAQAGRARTVLLAAGLAPESPPTGAGPGATAASTIVVPIDGPKELLLVLRRLDHHGCEVVDATVDEPTLDDVYLAFRRDARLRSA